MAGFFLAFTGYRLSNSQVFSPAKIKWITKVNPRGQRSKIMLPDSTIVYLGAGSRLRFPESFARELREISLSGEAFFEVKKNPNKPFIVHAGEIQTRVLGTSFKIEAFTGSPFSVQVSTGKVRVSRKTPGRVKALAVLLPGDRLCVSDAEVTKSKISTEDVLGWKDAKLNFNNYSLEDITGILGRWYDLRVTFKHKAKSSQRLSLILDANRSADKVFDLLASAAHFRYSIKNKEIFIY
ncbi:FecR family protein [Pedobacter lithocola]|uniref:FecR family protein n=1 Tax=Pedobacter lithocola TaxID=1908239 RepID=A0ABV8P6B2_9SPHI